MSDDATNRTNAELLAAAIYGNESAAEGRTLESLVHEAYSLIIAVRARHEAWVRELHEALGKLEESAGPFDAACVTLRDLSTKQFGGSTFKQPERK